MLRPLSFIQKLLSSFRNNFIIKSFLKAPKVLYHSEASKEACVLSYYGLFSCIPILVFFLRLSQYLFISLDWKEWLLLHYPDYEAPILAIFEAAYATTSNIGVVLVSSFFVFCWAGILMLQSLEDGLNKIFCSGITQASLKRLVSYFIITLVSPMIFIIVCGSWIYITQILPISYPKLFSFSHAMACVYVISRVLPYALLYGILFCCYAFLSRVPTQKSAAFLAAAIAGSAWVVSQKIFFCLQLHLFNYSFTYGALVALPSFLLLLYLYAIIYLFGGALAFLFQNKGFSTLIPKGEVFPNSYFKFILCLYFLTLISEYFDQSLPPPSASYLAQRAKASIGETAQCLDILEKEGMILKHKDGYKPSHNISSLHIDGIFNELTKAPSFSKICAPTLLPIQENLARILTEIKKSSHNLSLSEFAKKVSS